MIYRLQEEDFELSKLEYISKIYDLSSDGYDSSFNYQINGRTYTISDQDINRLIKLRENLLQSWQEFKKCKKMYTLEDHYIDLDKLEKISNISYDHDKRGYCFRYSVNGFTWDLTYYREDKAKEVRDNLLKAWYSYKESVE